MRFCDDHPERKSGFRRSADRRQGLKSLGYFNSLVGFEDEVGMIHSIAHYFDHFGIKKGTVGLEHTFLTGAMMNMLTHPHAKPKKVAVKDCTSILSELRIVKDNE